MSETTTYFSIWSDEWDSFGLPIPDDDMEEIVRVPVCDTFDLIQDQNLLSFIFRLSSALQTVDLYPSITQQLNDEDIEGDSSEEVEP